MIIALPRLVKEKPCAPRVIAHDDGTPDFRALRSKRRGHEAMLYAFDLIEHDGDDLRRLPLIERKRRLAKLIGKAKRRANDPPDCEDLSAAHELHMTSTDAAESARLAFR